MSRCRCLQNHHYVSKSSLKHHPSNGPSQSPLVAQNGNFAAMDTSSKSSHGGDSVNGPGALSRSYDNDDSADTMLQDDGHDHDHPEDEQDDRLGRGDQPHKRSKDKAELSDEESKWIHRDKLAKIESEELQAAGFVLPPSRSRSRPRRERSQSSSTKRMGPDNHTRSRKNSPHPLEPKTPETSAVLNGAEDGDTDVPSRPLTGSRIPVPKKSPLPISASQSRENSPEVQDKRIEPARTRPRSNSTTLKGLESPAPFKTQPAKRSATDISPKKQPTATVPRKPSAPAKTIPPEARGKVKPKGKNGSNGSSNNTRPNTRSGELSPGSKPMEGEPPWMISAYKPDPRLPPDQQLLPTVAKRLQQEKWEQEGKFGSIYDKDFRPLTDEGFLTPSATMPSSSSTDNIIKQEVEKPDEWPLRSPEAPKSPASIGRSSTYSTMPKIQDKPPTASPLPSPKPPPQAVMPSPPPRPPPTQITRVPDVSEKEDPKDAKKKGDGCGCCVVM